MANERFQPRPTRWRPHWVLPDDGWRERAACATLPVEWFVPSDSKVGKMGNYTQARQACAECPVSEECLAFALVTSMSAGMWAGTSQRERRRLRYDAQLWRPCRECGKLFDVTSSIKNQYSPNKRRCPDCV